MWIILSAQFKMRNLSCHFKSLKIFTFTASFSQKYIRFELKNTQELYFMILISDAKFDSTLTCGFKNDMTNLLNFHQSTQKSEKLYFHGLFLFKVYNVRPKKLHKSYVS